MWPFSGRRTERGWLRAYAKGKRRFSGLDATRVSLEGLSLEDALFEDCKFSEAKLQRARLTRCQFITSDFTDADFSDATIDRCQFEGCNLVGTSYSRAKLAFTRMDHSLVAKANFSNAVLGNVSFREARIIQSDFSGAPLAMCHFDGCRTATQRFLAENSDVFPATLTQAQKGAFAFNRFNDETLRRTIDLHGERKNNIDQWSSNGDPQSRGADLYASIDSLRNFFAMTGMQELAIAGILNQLKKAPGTKSIFVSYASADIALAEALYDWLSRRGFHVWFAPRDMESGAEVRAQLVKNLYESDLVLVVLSPSSLKSDWVRAEVLSAMQREKATKQFTVFPVRTVAYEALDAWHVIDESSGEDFAAPLRRRYIPDFSGWQEPAVFPQIVGDLVQSFARVDTPRERDLVDRRPAEGRTGRVNSLFYGPWCAVAAVDRDDNLVQSCKLCDFRDQIEPGLRIPRNCPDCGLGDDPGDAPRWFKVTRGDPDGTVTVTCKASRHAITYPYRDGPPMRCPECIATL